MVRHIFQLGSPSVMTEPRSAAELSEVETDDWPTLLAAARAGDDVALGQICERLRDYLRLTAEKELGRDLVPKVGASDIVQQTLLEACRGIAAFRGSTQSEYQAWMLRLLQRNVIDVARAFRGTLRRDCGRETALEWTHVAQVASDQKSASSLLRRRETDDELERAIGRLTDRQRQVVELRHRHGRSFAEIAELLGITVVVARKTWSRAVQRLSREMRTDDSTQSGGSDASRE